MTNRLAAMTVGMLGMAAACASESPNVPRTPSVLQGQVKLLAPEAGGRFKQNDPAVAACSDHPARGRGFRLGFDWQAVPGADKYRILFWHKGSQFPAVSHEVTESGFEQTFCNAFVIDSNLDHWIWRVAAVAGSPPVTLWSEEREYGFEPCRLNDSTPCHAPPTP